MSTHEAKFTFTRHDLDAVIFDMDGVITRTARLHAQAWKTLFDEFLARRGVAQQSMFDADSDYRRYVDGKPREDGVRDFLRVRGIELPRGHPDDPPDHETISGLGQRKNAIFLQLLEQHGVEVFESSLALVRTLRAAGIRTAVVSSSRNALTVLQAAGVLELFDARVDGIDARNEALAGKPAPDIFLAAARRLGVARAAIVEDALAGVAAGRAGAFAVVIGVDRANQADALRAHGADRVVRDLAELAVAPAEAAGSALAALPQIAQRLGARRLALFLDFDGTLTPIVERPDLAVLSAPMRATLRRLARLCGVAVVSGRDLDDIRERVGVAGLAYAGSHGFDIIGPAGRGHAPAAAEAAVPDLDAAEHELRARLAEVRGALLERKRFGLAVHFRMVAPGGEVAVERAVEAALRGRPRLEKRHGKKVFELLPAIAWDKGAAVQWLREAFGWSGPETMSMYVGDDVTDEDAFRVLHNEGIGIVVSDVARPTAAHYRLDDPQQVAQFLNLFADRLEQRR
jgi:trehalose 6-phosphate phosphatase